MTVFRLEMKRGAGSLLIWAGSIAALIFICMMLYPQMSAQMGDMNEMFAQMGAFTAAFGMDKLSFGEVMGYYGIECGNMLGIGGAFFAAVTGAAMLSKEEHDRTAEFLFTQPLSRARIITQKLAALVALIITLNAICLVVALASFALTGETVQWGKLLVFHGAQLLLQLQLGCIGFGISAFIKGSSAGVGIGAAMLLYFLNIIANISDSMGFLKYFTPYAYADASYVMVHTSINGAYLAAGAVYTGIALAAAYLKYTKKDISC